MELAFEVHTNQSRVDQSSFFWTDPQLFDHYQERNVHTFIALHQALKRHTSLQGSEQEFLEIYDAIAADPSQYFSQVWADPAAYHWCQLAFDLIKTTLTGLPLPLVTQHYCQAIGQKTPANALIAHLNQFKLFAIAHAVLSQQRYQFRTPFIPRLPLAIPGTSLYLEGTELVEIHGIDRGKLELIVKNSKTYLELTTGATVGDGLLKVGQCPTIQYQDWALRLQPYCFNSPAFPDGQFAAEAGMDYQANYLPLVQDGLALIEQYHPQTFKQLHYFTQVLALKPLGLGDFTNLTSSDFPGALICSVIDNPYRLADNFIHEFHHNRLFLIEQNTPLLLDSVEDAQANNLYYSPWRLDLRPLRGILHALYVYTPVAQFWVAVYRAGTTGELLGFAKSQLLSIPLQLQMGLEQLRKYARFTALGNDLFQELESQVAQLLQEIAQFQLSLDLPVVSLQHNGSFLYQLREGTAQFLTVKETTLNHIRRFDRFHQIETDLQVRLGLDPFSKTSEIVEQAPAIAYGERVMGTVELLPTLAEALKQRIDRVPMGSLVNLGDHQDVTKTYAELWQQATTLLGYLQAQGLSPGNVVILQLENCHDFVAAVWSCFLGGFVAVPVAITPHSSPSDPQPSKLRQVWQTLDHPAILTTNDRAATTSSLLPEPLPEILTIDAAQTADPSEAFHANQPEELALLLTSSGTTGIPKLISFDAITVISQFLSGPVSSDNSYCFLSWIPFDNASGFGIVNPNFAQKLYLPTERFFRNPLIWLDIVDRYRVNGSMLTNFAMTRIIEQLQQVPHPHWDLTSIKAIGLGAERIIAQTCRAFLQKLQTFGLAPNVLNFAYGLSECGVVASTNQLLEMGYANRNEQFVQIGKPLPGCAIRIVDHQNNLLNENEVGRIQIRGSAMVPGYYNNPSLNRSLFTEDGWLNSGDLGFLTNDSLTITGREKDIIIINAKNYSCQEIENLVNAVNGVDAPWSVACPIRDQGDKGESNAEQFVVFFVPSQDGDEESLDLATIGYEIRKAISSQAGISPTFLIPVTKEQIPRTATGKVQRYLLSQQLEAGQFNEQLQQMAALFKQHQTQAFVPPTTEIEQTIVKLWSSILGVKHVGILDNFFALGGTSLSAIQFCAEMSTHLEQPLAVVSLFQAQTVRELANLIRENRKVTPTALIMVQPTGSKPPLVFINSASTARNLLPWMDPDQPVYDLNLFGLTPLLKDRLDQLQLQDIAQHFIQDLQTVQPIGPYQLAGYCQNGALTLEVAHQLQQQGETVALVCLIDALFKPYHPNLWHRLVAFGEFGGRYLPYSWSKLEKRLHATFRSIEMKVAAIGKARSETTTTPSQNDELAADYDDSYYAELILEDQRLYNIYLRISSYFSPDRYQGKITLLLANEWRFADLSRLQSLALGGLEVYPVKGLHHHLFEEPDVKYLAGELQKRLLAH